MGVIMLLSTTMGIILGTIGISKYFNLSSNKYVNMGFTILSFLFFIQIMTFIVTFTQFYYLSLISTVIVIGGYIYLGIKKLKTEVKFFEKSEYPLVIIILILMLFNILFLPELNVLTDVDLPYLADIPLINAATNSFGIVRPNAILVENPIHYSHLFDGILWFATILIDIFKVSSIQVMYFVTNNINIFILGIIALFINKNNKIGGYIVILLFLSGSLYNGTFALFGSLVPARTISLYSILSAIITFNIPLRFSWITIPTGLYFSISNIIAPLLIFATKIFTIVFNKLFKNKFMPLIFLIALFVLAIIAAGFTSHYYAHLWDLIYNSFIGRGTYINNFLPYVILIVVLWFVLKDKTKITKYIPLIIISSPLFFIAIVALGLVDIVPYYMYDRIKGANIAILVLMLLSDFEIKNFRDFKQLIVSGFIFIISFAPVSLSLESLYGKVSPIFTDEVVSIIEDAPEGSTIYAPMIISSYIRNINPLVNVNINGSKRDGRAVEWGLRISECLSGDMNRCFKDDLTNADIIISVKDVFDEEHEFENEIIEIYFR